MSDGFLALAQTPAGLSCFLVPRWLPDGTRNSGFKIMRLKDKVAPVGSALAWSSHGPRISAISRRYLADRRPVERVV